MTRVLSFTGGAQEEGAGPAVSIVRATRRKMA